MDDAGVIAKPAMGCRSISIDFTPVVVVEITVLPGGGAAIDFTLTRVTNGCAICDSALYGAGSTGGDISV